MDKPAKLPPNLHPEVTNETHMYNYGYNKAYDDFNAWLPDEKELKTLIHNTRAWQALHLELQAEILDDVKGHLAKAIARQLGKEGRHG